MTRLSGTPASIAEGQVFLIPHRGRFIVGQVSEGLDLAVFDGLWDEAPTVEELPPAKFRVHFAYASIRKHGWKAASKQPLVHGLQQAAAYAHRAIGSDECYKVIDGRNDELIDCDEAERLEPLATWSHQHIVRRFDDPTYRG